MRKRRPKFKRAKDPGYDPMPFNRVQKVHDIHRGTQYAVGSSQPKPVELKHEFCIAKRACQGMTPLEPMRRIAGLCGPCARLISAENEARARGHRR